MSEKSRPEPRSRPHPPVSEAFRCARSCGGRAARLVARYSDRRDDRPLHLEWRADRRRRGRSARHASPVAPGLRTDGHERGVRRGRVRRLRRGLRRRGRAGPHALRVGQQLPRAALDARRTNGRERRGDRDWRSAASGAGGDGPPRRVAVRVLHAGVRGQPLLRILPAGSGWLRSRVHQRQPLPLHGVSTDRRRGARSAAAKPRRPLARLCSGDLRPRPLQSSKSATGASSARPRSLASSPARPSTRTPCCSRGAPTSWCTPTSATSDGRCSWRSTPSRSSHGSRCARTKSSSGPACRSRDIEERLRAARAEHGVEVLALEALLPLFSSRLIRNRATLGGNLATGSPIGDAAPVLLTLDARVKLASARGERPVDLSDFFVGYRKTALAQGEVIVSVHLPRPLPKWQRFYKVSKRVLDDISTRGRRLRARPRRRTAGSSACASPTAASPRPRCAPLPSSNKRRAGHGRQRRWRSCSTGSRASGRRCPTPAASAAYRAALGTQAPRTLLLRNDDLWRGRSVTDRPASGPEESRAKVHWEPIVGQPVSHESAEAHVTGRAKYVDDLWPLLPRLAHAWPVVAPHTHARVLSVDARGGARASRRARRPDRRRRAR